MDLCILMEEIEISGKITRMFANGDLEGIHRMNIDLSRRCLRPEPGEVRTKNISDSHYLSEKLQAALARYGAEEVAIAHAEAMPTA